MAFADWSIGRKLATLVGVAIAGLAATGTWLAVEQRRALYEDRQRVTREVVEAAWAVAAHYRGEEAAGRLPREAAQRAAREVLKSLRYDGSEYVWINDTRPYMVMHPIKPELDGRDLSGMKDPAGKALFVEFARVAKGGRAGFVDYLWPKPGASEPVPKISYVMGLADWDWVVGSGVYVDDVEAALRAKLARLAGVLAGLAALVAAFAGYIAWRIRTPLAQAALVATAVADGRLDSRIAVHGRDETGRVLEALARMQSTLLERTEADRKARAWLERLQQALDGAPVATTVTDEAGAIVYANRAALALLADGGALAGQDLLAVAGAEAAKAGMPARAGGSATYAVARGGRRLVLTDGPVADAQGAYLGRVTQWQDRTAELAAEADIARVVEAASHGDFSARVDPSGKHGFLLHFAGSLNALLDRMDSGLREVVRVLGALARGDLTQTVDGRFEGTFARMQDDANRTVAELRAILERIQEASDAIGTASSEIAAGNRDLSSRTDAQAASLQQTATSMGQLTGTVRGTADSARRADALAGEASSVALRGGEVVGRVVTTMAGIEAASRRIGEIIGVIDGIAFQTNILALNAAVEAARAGESGRGFAVVASEVRTLAQRSAEAAREVKQLIGDSVEQVGAGTRLVRDAGATMQDIVASVGKVTEIMATIRAATREQTGGIEQVNRAIAQMDEATQRNAALVGQSAAAAESMKHQAGGLVEAIRTFQLETTT